MPLTYTLIALTCVISFFAFSNTALLNKFIFYPPAITKNNEWYRFISCGFIHADVPHLVFNMYSYYMFGKVIEDWFEYNYQGVGKLLYLLLYISSFIVCLLPTYFKNKNNYHYRSLGASGAVSAIVFAFIFLAPTQGIGLIFIPYLHAPAFAFGIIYLGISAYLAKRGDSNINHSAHFWGAVYGILFITVITKFGALENFITQVKNSLGL